MELSIRGIVTTNYELEISKDNFDEACQDAGLKSENLSKFTSDDWTKLNKHIKQIVDNLQADIDHTEIHHTNTIKVDEIHIDTKKDLKVVQYDMDGVFSGFDNR
jgi:hypothetical protein